MTTLNEHIATLKSIPGVTSVTVGIPDSVMQQQIGNGVETTMFTVTNGSETFNFIAANAFLQTSNIQPATSFITSWFGYLAKSPDTKTTTFYLRDQEDRVVQLKGSLKIADAVPANAQALADKMAAVAHVVQVKVRQIIDPALHEAANCTDALHFHAVIDVRTQQSTPAINIYVPKVIWDDPEQHSIEVQNLEAQINTRIENSKAAFGG